MSIMNLSLANHRSSRRAPRLGDLWKLVVEWHQRVQSRQELMNLSESDLRDIGLSRCEVERETSKPFWHR